MSLVEQLKESKVATENILDAKPGGTMGAIIPRNYTELLDMANIFSASKMAPKTLDSPAKIAVALQYGLEIGLPPIQAMQNIAVINQRPCLWGDALPALMYKHGHKLHEEIQGNDKDLKAICTLTRGDTGQKTVREFSYKDAEKAGLVTNPKKEIWRKYTARMCAMRARSWAIRDGAPDALIGLSVAEEVQDYQEPNIKDVTSLSPPSPPSPPSPSKQAEQDKIDALVLSDEEVLENLDSQMSPTKNLDELNEVWVEFEGENDGLPHELEEEAQELYEKHEARIKDAS